MKTEKHTLLKHYFGHDHFRPLQEEAVDAILEGKDLLMILPTGGGKSLCYQLPTLLMDGVTIVISPLLALMHDQVLALGANGITAEMLSSMQDVQQSRAIEARLEAGDIRLLYVAPERLNHPSFLSLLHRIRINFFVVDEAHCVSEWGHEFREDYRKLSWLKQEFPRTAIASFTATATETVERDIARQLKLSSPIRLRGTLFRDNLLIQAEHRTGNGRAQLLNFLSRHHGEAGIVYTLSRRQTESLAAYLNQNGFSARAYHAGLPAEEKNRSYADFVSDRVQIVVATIAFGMGIDKSNIRFVVHMTLPKTLENYYQEIGRAGRDGLPSETLLLFSAADGVQQRAFIDALPEGAYKQHAYEKLDVMMRFASGETCRHQAIARYFGDTIPACGEQCDNCRMPESEKIDITTPSRKLLSAIMRTGQRFGLPYVVDVLRGSRDQRIRNRQHDTLSVYGIGDEYSKKQWRIIGDRLLELGAVQIGEYNVYALTPDGAAILRGAQPVTIKADRLLVHKKVAGSRRNIADLDAKQMEDFERLRVLRSTIAAKNNIPPYVVFSDKTLLELAIHRPRNREEMLTLHGVGEIKFERYGEAFLAELHP